MKNTEIGFYVDTLLIEAFINDSFIKTADNGFVNTLIDKVKEYFNSKIDPNDKVGSVLNLLAPGAISVIFSALGLGKIGSLIGLAMSVFHIDVKAILSSIYDKIKGLISNGNPTTSEAIHNAVMSTVQEHTKPATEEEANEFFKKNSYSKQLREVKLLKLSVMEYEKFKKTGASNFLNLFSSRKSKTASILGNILSWFFRIALASAGLVVAGDAVNKFLNRPNSFDNTIQKGKPVEEEKNISKQTKFKIKPSYTEKILNNPSVNWIEKITNNKTSIETMLIQFANEVYDGLSGLDNIIKSSPAFKEVVDKIEWFNHTSQGSPLVFIPKIFTSKKNLVDWFMDDIEKISN